MSITQQHVRRRGSSLDENSIRTVLAQQQLFVTSSGNNYEPEEDEDKKFNYGQPFVIGTLPDAPIQSKTEALNFKNLEITKGAWKKVLLMMILSAIVGAFFAFFFGGSSRLEVVVVEETNPQLANQAAQQEKQRKSVFACMVETAECPHLPEKILESDYPLRFQVSGQEKPRCYTEDSHVNKNCESTCEMLFRKLQTETDGEARAVISCQIGCKYAEREITTKAYSARSPNCHWDCKNTVWTFAMDKTKCNYGNGLGLATKEFEDIFGSGVFGVGKACEIGCIIGNSRPCATCA
jgi:hypothetical protein